MPNPYKPASGAQVWDVPLNIALDRTWDRTPEIFNVKDSLYGAKGDGVTDDTAAINAAFASVPTTGGIVFFPPGTYIVSVLAGSLSLGIALSVLTTGTTILGSGHDTTIIKLAASQPDYVAIITDNTANGTTDLSGLTIRDLTIDQNSANNIITAVGPADPLFTGKARFVLRVYKGNRTLIENCRFTNIDNVNTITVNGGPATVSDVTIRNNIFDNVGANSPAHDHSSIYIQAPRATVQGNTFLGGGVSATTAIETHGDLQQVHDNIIKNFYCGANLTGIASSSLSTSFSHNEILGAGTGVELWARTYTGNATNYGMEDVLLESNTIEIDLDQWAARTGFKSGILFDASSSLGYHNLDIKNNIIRYKSFSTVPTSTDAQSAGITFYRPSGSGAYHDDNITIEGNTIENPPAAGIYLQPKSILTALRVLNNRIINPGTGNSVNINAAFKVGIMLTQPAGVGSMTDVQVNNNELIDNRATHIMSAGIDTTFVTAVTNGEVISNIMRIAEASAGVPDFKASATPAPFFVRSRTGYYVAIANPTLYGSQVIDPTNGAIYTQVTSPSGTSWSTIPVGTQATDVQTFTANGTWTKPAWASATSRVTVVCISGGGGGGSGRRTASGTAASGGSGGAGGAITRGQFTANQLTATETVVVGTGGTGGAAISVDSTDGNPGTDGGVSSFSTSLKSRATKGFHGLGGSTATVAGGSGGLGDAPGGGGGQAALGLAGGGSSGGGAAGGGGGGGIATTPANLGGGTSNTASGNGATNNGAAGTSGGGNGGNATAAADLTVTYGGCGGGGGGSNIAGTGGTGGNGSTYGGGGGGGGASLNGSNSGAGGNGAAGIVQVVTTY